MESSLRTLFVKQHLDLLGPRTSFRYADGIELNLLKAFQGKVSLFELLVYFKADFLITPTVFAAPWLGTLMKMPGYTQELENTTSNIIDIANVDLSEYDLVISHDPIIPDVARLKAMFPKTIFAYILAEHSSWQMHELGMDYDLFLDHTYNSVDEIVRLPQSLNFVFPRVPEKINEMFPPSRESIFLDYRSIGYFISGGSNNVKLNYEETDRFISSLDFSLPVERLSKTSLEPYMFNTYRENDSVEYYKKLSRAKYFVSIANRVGQAAFDAASAGALVIGTKLSNLHCLLCDDTCLVEGENININQVKDLINKIEEENLYEQLVEVQRVNLVNLTSPAETLKKGLKLK